MHAHARMRARFVPIIFRVVNARECVGNAVGTQHIATRISRVDRRDTHIFLSILFSHSLGEIWCVVLCGGRGTDNNLRRVVLRWCGCDTQFLVIYITYIWQLENLCSRMRLPKIIMGGSSSR